MKFLAESSDLQYFTNASTGVKAAIIVVGIFIAVCGVISIIVSIALAIKYHVYNKTQNSAGLTGEQAARKLLDDNGLQHIRVTKTGSLLFGNSYSHYFKKIRLRRLTYKKTSITSLAMAAEKTSLAVMDKEGDPDMKKRIRLVPLVTFGPYAFIPLIFIGVILDIIMFNGSGVVTLIFAGIGILFYVFAFVLTLMTLKTEMKAQKRAYEVLRNSNMATEDEIKMMEKLFKLYNIEYINDMVLAFLEILYRVLMIVARAQSSSSSSR